MYELLAQDIIKGFKIESKEESVEMLSRFNKMIFQAILVRSLDILSEKEQIALDLLLDEDKTTQNDVLTFLKSKIPTFDRLVEEEKVGLKSDLLVTTA